MNATTYREGCGTHMGMLLHQAEGEPPCGECLRGELLRRVAAEEWPSRTRPRLGPISREQAARNLATLMAAMADDHEREPSDPPPPDPTDREETRHGRDDQD
ncbi:hypothetical protein ABZ897_00595 [Nonomuraea sp. NPDC046802]|uniref:hypothetical protein n=1 Tax=Nonomuraea sp. NPDC046802 TaxID=3154919 RepID=UPI0033E87A9F